MIFNLFKSKPNLIELIPKGYVDIHSHILPGVDDGAKNIKESINLISEMNKIGFRKIIATPHTYPGLYDNTNESIKKSFDNIQINISKDNKISYASEYMVDNSLRERVENKSILTLKKNYVLIEMSFFSKNEIIYEIIFFLLHNNYIPILAHPERYLYFEENFKEFYKLKSRGCLFQINLLSLTGFYGKRVLNLSNKLMSDNLFDFSGSDIHNMHHINAIKKGKILKFNANKEKKILNLNENNIRIFG